jgi:hypothetical protein
LPSISIFKYQVVNVVSNDEEGLNGHNFHHHCHLCDSIKASVLTLQEQAKEKCGEGVSLEACSPDAAHEAMTVLSDWKEDCQGIEEDCQNPHGHGAHHEAHGKPRHGGLLHRMTEESDFAVRGGTRGGPNPEVAAEIIRNRARDTSRTHRRRRTQPEIFEKPLEGVEGAAVDTSVDTSDSLGHSTLLQLQSSTKKSEKSETSEKRRRTSRQQKSTSKSTSKSEVEVGGGGGVAGMALETVVAFGPLWKAGECLAVGITNLFSNRDAAMGSKDNAVCSTKCTTAEDCAKEGTPLIFDYEGATGNGRAVGTKKGDPTCSPHANSWGSITHGTCIACRGKKEKKLFLFPILQILLFFFINFF